MMRPFLFFFLILLRSSLADSVLVPEVAGPWWDVAGQPDLGSLGSDRQEPVDFGVWQANDGTWQLWSCIRKTQESGTGRLFHGWEGKRLTDSDWTPQGIQMRAHVAVGEVEGGLQAPFVKVIDGTHHLFYGTWQGIALALSRDGKYFQRQIDRHGKVGLFVEPVAQNARDAMVIHYRGQYYCYYTSHPDKVGRVCCRTSRDLKTWSEPVLVRIGGDAGDKLWSHECPHVVRQGDGFYLFTTQRYLANPQTSVFYSRDPLHFGLHDDRTRVAHLPVAAPEILQHEGQWYIAALKPQLDGIRIARLQWRLR
jgi:hypothetical protein